jgi:hypothetical protein
MSCIILLYLSETLFCKAKARLLDVYITLVARLRVYIYAYSMHRYTLSTSLITNASPENGHIDRKGFMLK